MIRDSFSRRFILSLGFVLAVSALVLASRAVRAGQDTQQGQSNQSQGQGQTQTQEKPKKKGGFLSGVKAMTESSKEQTSATASAGTKGVGEGTQISDVTPSAADRQAVTQIENYSVAQGDLSKFIEAGHLKEKP